MILPCLQIKEARVVMDPRTKESRGFGFVDFEAAKVSTFTFLNPFQQVVCPHKIDQIGALLSVEN